MEEPVVVSFIAELSHHQYMDS